MTTRCLLSLLFAVTGAVAQSMPVADGRGRMLQVFDLKQLQAAGADDDRPGPELRLSPPAPTVDVAVVEQDDQYHAAFLRPFVVPSLGDGDDLKVLGKRWLTLLGSPAQIASLQQLLAHAAANREQLVTVAVRLLRLDRQAFAQRLQPLLARRSGANAAFEAVLPAATAAELSAAIAGADTLEAPRLTVTPLQRGTVSVQNQTAYVRDFTLTPENDALIADPVIDTVWDGVVVDLCAIVLADGVVGLRCDVQSQQLQKPIQQFQVDLGVGTPVTIQLPRTTGVHFQQTARLAVGDLVVLAAQKAGGDYLVAVVEAQIETR